MQTILIIEDDEQIRDIIRQTAELLNYGTLTASDGAEGIKILKEQDVDLIVTDIIMPRKEGIETIVEAKIINPSVKIIAVSGGGRIGPKSYLELAEGFGADRVFTKPFELEELVEAIDSLLNE